MTTNPPEGSNGHIMDRSGQGPSDSGQQSTGGQESSQHGRDIPASPQSLTPDQSSRVRFSVEFPTSKDHLRSSAFETQPSRSGPKEYLKPATRARDRGYSLRRSLFAQNVEKLSAQPRATSESSAEKTIPGAISAPIPEIPSSDGGLATATGTGSNEKTDNLRDHSLPLSDPEDQLPLYRRWMSKQHSRTTILQRFGKKYVQIRDKFAQRNTIPPSVDGRHVRINVRQGNDPIDERTGNPYINNLVRSCRYTPWNFVPRQLAAQFGKLANFYFLCISILQMIPGLSTTGTFTTIIPLMIFVAISMAKEGYDDLRRHRLDKEENERSVKVLRAREEHDPAPKRIYWQEKKWKEIGVGDVVLLERDCGVPADLVLLHADKPTRTAFVETKSLDGETNLKSKVVLEDLSPSCQALQATGSFDAEFVVEDPNLDLYKFDGRVNVNGRDLPLTNTEVLYRGSVLRNTPSAMGLVIYSGEECKIRMNANKNPRIKAPALQAKVNRVVIVVACLVFFIAIVLSVGYVIWGRTTENKAFYLQSAKVPFGHILVSFVIMLNTMLPLSLYVSLEIVKVAQMFLMNDVDMYDPESDTPMEPHTSTINEELGQVSYIFSDKTGTLTNNSMKFRKMSIVGTSWLHDLDLQQEASDQATREKLWHKKRGVKAKDNAISKKDRRSLSKLSRKSFTSIDASADHIGGPAEAAGETSWKAANGLDLTFDTGTTRDLINFVSRRPHSLFARKARFFLLSLALCHTCMPEKDEDGDITYQAASPDEVALVTAAQDLGYVVCDRQSRSVTVQAQHNPDDEAPSYETYEVLDVIEFSSARKRMSIIVRLPDHRICLFTKGADTTIRKLLRLADLAASNVQAVERRASQRKSVEIHTMVQRRSTQLSNRSQSIHHSEIITPRRSSVSLNRAHTVRDSIDHWLRERETDAGVGSSRPRKSLQFYPTRQSSHFEPRRSDTIAGRWRQSTEVSPRTSVQHDRDENLVDENLAVDDASVFERCFQHIDDFATEGLRTLLYGYRYLTADEYTAWKELYVSATTSIVDRQDKIERAAEGIESKLELLGATAIEDKLQKGVPDAIDRLRRAGIKLWMLTGDKRETAINIGRSCRLIKDYSTVVVLDHELGDLHRRMTNAFHDIKTDQTPHSVLVIDGQTLTLIDADPAAKAIFTDVAIRADSVICCRASPSQKASLVKTIRTKVAGSVTLAVGDGANDIAMIQEAHVGIGIAGKEGLQAARTSDYSIAQFRFLLKLLLVHGRWNYVRVCKYTLGTFWKEMLFYLVQATYQRWTGYTGTSLYESWSLSMFNTLFTSLPVIFMGVFEKDLAASTLLAVPELYNYGRCHRGFNFPRYFWWAGLGACEAMIVYFMAYSLYGEASFTRDQGLYALGSLAFSACVVIISLKMQFIQLHAKTAAAAVAIFLSIGGWWLWNLILSDIYPYDVIYNVNHAFLSRFGRNLHWWTTLALMILAVCLLEVTIQTISAGFWPTDVEIFQSLEQDREVRKRFEEAAADLLQQGWNRGTKKSSLELTREATIQAEREAQVQELLDKPRKMEEKSWVQGSRPVTGAESGKGVTVHHAEEGREMEKTQRKSIDIGELFSKGFGAVRKSQDLRR